MPTVEEAFESPRLVLDGARTGIQKVKAMIDAFMAEQPYRFVIEKEAHRGVAYAEILKKPSPEIRRSVYRAVNDLRNALDHAIYGASEALGVHRPKRAQFPFRTNPTDLDRAFTTVKGMCRDVPIELHALIKSFEPYPGGHGYIGGDDALRHLGAVSNPNKHSIALRIQPTINGDIRMAITTAPGALKIIKPTWNSAKTKLTLFYIVKSTDFHYNVDLGADIVFDEAPIKDVSVNGFLGTQLPKVTMILDRLEAVTRRILASCSP